MTRGTLRFQRGGSRPRDREDPLCGRQGGTTARADRLDRGRWLHPRGHQFLFLLRYVGGAHVSGTGHRQALPAPHRVAGKKKRAPRGGARAPRAGTAPPPAAGPGGGGGTRGRREKSPTPPPPRRPPSLAHIVGG